MDKFEKIKIKMVMKAEKVSRERAMELVAMRCKSRRCNDPVKVDDSAIASDSCDLLGADDLIDAGEMMSAEEFFGA